MELYTRYGPAVMRKCLRLLQHRQDAEDVVQALFTDLLQQGQTTVELPYLYRAATNRCLNLLRDTGRRRELLAEQAEELRGPVRTRCEEQVIEAELLAHLLRRLDARSAEVLVYRFYDDLTQEEIAELLGLSRKTVGKLLEQIRQTVLRLAARGEGGQS